jgi:hypothetical protein
MPKIRPLTPGQAGKTLAHKLGVGLVPRLRQLATNFGIRPYRCFLVWGKWTGEERGEGFDVELLRMEILPTPKVENLDALTFSLVNAGTLPVGSVRVSQISSYFTYDQLKGLMVPVQHEDQVPEPYEFYWEVVEDGRGDNPPVRAKFRPASVPFRRAGKPDWTVILERISEDNLRSGANATGTGEEG